MQKTLLVVQKVVFYLFAIISISALVYSLSFMTDFKTLYQQMGGPGDFHDEVLQVFNRALFNASLLTVVGFVIIYLFDFKSKVSDIYGLVVLYVVGIFNVVKSFGFIAEMKEIAPEFLGLDFSLMLLPANTVYEATARTFEIGQTLYLTLAIISIVLILISTVNTILYFSLKKGVGEYE